MSTAQTGLERISSVIKDACPTGSTAQKIVERISSVIQAAQWEFSPDRCDWEEYKVEYRLTTLLGVKPRQM